MKNTSLGIPRNVTASTAPMIPSDDIGIPAAEQERVFEPFYRMDRSRDRDTGGFGLGLAISRRAIECQGGKIVVDSSTLGGARFEISLPFSRAG